MVIVFFLLAAGAKLCGCFSVVDDFGVELTNAVVPVLLFAEFWLCDAAESLVFQGL